MKALLQIFWQTLCFKRGPEDTPYAINLLWLLLTLNLTLSVFTQYIARPQQANIVVFLPLISLSVEFVVLYSLLQFKRLSARFVQTFTTILGVDCLLTLASIPLIILGINFLQQTVLLKILGLLEVILVGWSIAVRAFIYHRALNIGFFLANILALMVLLLSLSVTVKVFPELFEQAKAAASQSSR